MQSEELENKVREAAEHHHPAYDEKAWGKMGKLLDKHLPQKKDDPRRIAFILLFILLLGGGGFLLITRPWQTSRPIAITGNEVQQVLPITPTPGNGKEDIGKSTLKDAGNNDNASRENKVLVAKEEKETIIPGRNKPTTIPATKILAIKKQQEKPDLIAVQENYPKEGKNKRVSATNDPVVITRNAALVVPVKDKEVVLKDDKGEDNLPQVDKSPMMQSPEKNADKKGQTDPKSKTGTEINSVEKVPDPAITGTGKKIKDTKKKSNSFFLSLSAGPDVSAVGTEGLGKIKFMVGGSVGYTFGNKLTVRTGFFSSRKIYTASPDEYHPPEYFWQYYPDLKQVDADCKVFEIPLSFSYNFSSSARQSWFGTAGLSSYLMKRETYDYLYKNSSGQLLSWQASLYNENKHYFSVLTLSGGYQRNINNTFSVMAEPFLKIPMSGVGYGKVKLLSGGLLFSLGIHPFHSAKAKRTTEHQPL